MSESRYEIRNYRPDDLASYVQLHTEAESLDRAGYCTSLRTLCEILGKPGYSPRNDLFVAGAGGKVVGCMNLTPEPGIGRVVLNCLVHPEYRRKGLATQLLNEAVKRASSLGAGVVQGCIAEGNTAARECASGLGFTFVHRFLELRLSLSGARFEQGLSPPACRHLRLGEEELLVEVQNRSFADTWGYNPGTVESISYRVSQGDCCPEGIILVCEGEQPAGYCWTTVNIEDNAAATLGIGRIYMLGVLPEHRGRGLGRRALTAGLTYLESRGIETVDLTVDSENVEACALYESAGFKIRSTTDWYEKKL